MSSPYLDKIKQELEAGNLPKDFMDDHLLFAEQHDAGKAFSAYGMKIARRLLGVKQGEPDPPIRFLLSGEEKPNAFFVSFARPVIVSASAGLIKRIESEDELAAVIAHELGHREVFKTLGRHINSSMEEDFADVAAVKMLYEAGYQPDSLEKVFNKLDEPPDDLFSRLARLGDPHSEHHTRIRNVQDGDGIIRRLIERPTCDPTPLGATFRTIATTTKRPTHIEEYLQGSLVKKQVRYSTVFEWQGKIEGAELISRLADLVQPELVLDRGESTEARRARVAEFRKVAVAIFSEHVSDTPECIAAMRKFFDQFCMHPTTEPVYRDWGSTGRYSDGSTYVAGAAAQSVKKEFKHVLDKAEEHLQELPNAVRDFVEATSKEKAIEAAKRLIQFSKIYDLRSPNVREEGKPLAAFSLPDHKQILALGEEIVEAPEAERLNIMNTKGLAPEWDKHMHWALEDKSPELITALHMLGVGRIDPRLPSLAGDWNYAASVSDNANHHYGWNVIWTSHIFTTPDGKILSYVPERTGPGGDGLTFNPPTCHERHDIFQKAMLSAVNWNELREDFQGFTQKYARYLVPLSDGLDGGYLFAERFMQECRNMLQEDKAKYAPLLKSFFTGKDGENTHSGRAPNSLPELWKRYRGYEESKVGISPNHPYTKFVVENPNGMFSVPERMAFFNHVGYFGYETKRRNISDVSHVMRESKLPNKYFENFRGYHWDDPHSDHSKKATVHTRKPIWKKEAWNLLPQTVFGYEAPHSFEALETLLKTFLQPPVTDKDLNVEGSYLVDTIHYEVARFCRYADKNNLPLTREQIHRLELVGERYEGHDKFQSYLESLKEKCTQREISGQASLEEVIDGYWQHTDSRNFGEKPELRKQYQDLIKKGIGQLKDDDQKIAMLERLAFKREYAHFDLGTRENELYAFKHYKGAKKEIDFVDPEFRQWVVDALSDAHAKKLGRDYGFKDYYARAEKTVDRIAEYTGGPFRYAVLDALAQKTLAQRPVAYHMRDAVFGVTNFEIMDHHMKSKVHELGLEELGDDAELRQKTIDFILNPPTEKRLEAFAKEVYYDYKDSEYKSSKPKTEVSAKHKDELYN